MKRQMLRIEYCWVKCMGKNNKHTNVCNLGDLKRYQGQNELNCKKVNIHKIISILPHQIDLNKRAKQCTSNVILGNLHALDCYL